MKKIKRDDIFNIIKNLDVIKDIDKGVTCVMVSFDKKRIPLIIKQKNNIIIVSRGKFIKHTYKFLLEELK